MKLIWYGHACFRLESAEGTLVFDPYSPGSVPGLELEPMEADMVLCSHKHGDHSCTQAVTLSKTTPLFSIQRIPTYHDDSLGLKRGNNLISLVEAESICVAHLGDLGHFPTEAQLEVLRRADVLLLPVGGFYTIDARQAAELVNLVSPSLVIPMHYRGKNFGLKNASELDTFLPFAGNVQYCDSNEIELNRLPDERLCLILKCPAEI